MEFPSQDKTVIIATKGLPLSLTELFSEGISRWARSPVFRPDGILGELYEEAKYNATSIPSKEEDERLQRRAFSILCQVAKVHLEFVPKVFNCVVINSSLSSTSQLDELIDFSKRLTSGPHKLIIVEHRMRHKYKWKQYAEFYIAKYMHKYWFLPKSWNEIEKAIEDYDAKAWDPHFDHLHSSLPPDRLLLKRLVLDPDLDLDWNELNGIGSTTTNNKERGRFSPFAKAIEYLLTDKAAPPVVDYRKWRKQLVERLFISNADNTIHLCSTNAGDCKFTHREDPLRHSTNPVPNTNTNTNINCRACEKQLATGEGAYACVSCGLAFHKSCADFPTHEQLYDDYWSWWKTPRYAYDFPAESTHACNSCSSTTTGFSYECRGCIFEAHLKCGKVPTVVNKTHLHPHPLSIQLSTDLKQYQGVYTCELCSRVGRLCSYYCVRCNTYYHLKCVHSPEELVHEHGRYLHPVKLTLPKSYNSDDDHDLQPAMFSREQYLDKDDFWCDVCYEEIDADAAYYSCLDCLDYVAHIYCISPLWEGRRRW